LYSFQGERVLKHGSPTGSQVLPVKLLQHEFLSLSTGPQFLPESRFMVGFPWCHIFLPAYPPAPVWGLPCAAVAQPASSWSSPWAEGESLLWHLEHLIPLLLP